jgi:transposase-like protein
MADRPLLRRLLDRTENTEFPLLALEAVRDLRRYLTAVEREAISDARTGGASVQEIADALGITRQAVYYKLSQPPAAGTEEPDEGSGGPDIVEIPDVEPSAPADDPRRPP